MRYEVADHSTQPLLDTDNRDQRGHTYLGPIIRLISRKPDVVEVLPRVIVGSGILLALLVQWGRAHWARKLAAALRRGGAASVYLVWAKANGGRKNTTVVAVFEDEGVRLHDRHRVTYVDHASIIRITFRRNGAMRPDSVLIESSTRGDLELTPLISNGALPSGEADAWSWVYLLPERNPEWSSPGSEGVRAPTGGRE